MESNSLPLTDHLRECTSSESLTKKYFRWLLRMFAVIAGLTAGLPWIATAHQLGRFSAVLSTLTSISVVIAFGLTTTWAFLNIVEKLNLPNQHNDILKKHILCHSLGLIVTIPTLYISYEYNSTLFYVAIAGLVSYGLSTAGLYQLIDVIFIKSKNTLLRFIKKDFAKIDFILSGIAFLLATVNAISVSVLSFKALQLVITNQIIAILLSIMIALPLFGLDYYATSETFFLFRRKISNNEEQNFSPFFSIIIFCGFILSAFSTLTDTYVVYTEVGNSFLHHIAIPLAINMWLSKTILETYSVMMVTYGIISILNRNGMK